MTDAGFLSLTPQLAAAHWGWTIAFFLWFIGLSGMLMALFYFVRDKRIALVSFIASILGCVFVLSHLARLTNLPFAAFNALISGSLISGDWAAMFWIGAVAAGILLPLAIRVFGEKARFAAPLCAVLALAGALCIRASVLFAGYFDPLV